MNKQLTNGRAIALGALLVLGVAIGAGCAGTDGAGSSSRPSQTAGPAAPETETPPPSLAEPALSATIDSGGDAAGSRPGTSQEATPLQSSRAVDVDVRQFRQLLPKDAIAPIYDPQFTPAERADLEPGELVIGVEINGESRAYPIGPLARREMVNDVIDGVPILVTW